MLLQEGLSQNNGAWHPFRDHTSLATNPNGRFLAVNIGNAAGPNGILYSKVINDIIPNQPVIVEAYLANLFRANFVGGVDPSFSFELVDGLGNVIAQQPQIPPTPNPTGIPPIPTILRSGNWEMRSVSLNPGNNTTLTFNVRSGSIQYSGNDAAIDDIKVYQLPKSCITTKDFTIVVPTGKAFTGSITGYKDVKCNGANDGEITIAAQNFGASFQYSIDNGATWTTSTTSPVTIPNLAAATYKIQIRPDATSAVACTKPFDQVIAAPVAIGASMTITTLATCSTGATITTTAIGGTPAYEYELRNAAGVAPPIRAYQSSNKFTNVPAGSYTIFVRDANLCSNPVGVPVTVDAPAAVTAVLAATSDLCYDTVNKATLVVTATGTGTLSYSLDSQTAQGSNTFNNVTPGTHDILVTDSNNCTKTISGIIIAKQLLADAIVSKTLDCSLSPAAIIDVTITDGIAPYTYKWKLDSGTYSSSNSVTGNTFSYPTTTVGLYTFEITDSKGCVTTTTATINSITNPTASANVTNPSCNNGTDGQIEIIGAGGSGGFTYSFNGGTFTAPSINTGLDAYVGAVNTKDYTYQVKDSKGCVSTVVYTATLSNPTKVAATASIPANACSNSTVITSSGNGGAGGYSYSFNGSTTYNGTNTLAVTRTISVQTITFSVKDSKGCIGTNTIDIPAYNPPTGINFSTPATITCLATTTSISLTPVAGVAPFTFTIISGATGNTSGDSTGTYTGLLPGNYVFEVKDANGCTKQATTTIGAAATIAVSGAKTDEKCFGANDGTATFTVTGFNTTNNYTVTIKNSLGTSFVGTPNASDKILLTGLAAETYTIVVKDNVTGCSSTPVSVTVAAATKITITGVTASNVNCNQSISNIVVTATGGVTSYKYAYVIAGSGMPVQQLFQLQIQRLIQEQHNLIYLGMCM